MAKLEDPGWRASLMEEVAGLWKDRKLCDMVIVSKDGQRFSAHSIILSAASPVLKEMIAGGNREITFDQSSSETCSALLNFIYTGELLFDGVEESEHLEEVKDIISCLQISKELASMLGQVCGITGLPENSLNEISNLQHRPGDDQGILNDSGEFPLYLQNMDFQSIANNQYDDFLSSSGEFACYSSDENPAKRAKKIRKREAKKKRDAKSKLLKGQCPYCGLISSFGITKFHVHDQHYTELVNNKKPEEVVKEYLKIKCQECGDIVARDDLDVHVFLQHSAPTGKKTNRGRYQKMKVGCLYCGEVVRNMFYMDHLQEKHPNEAEKFMQTGRGRGKKSESPPKSSIKAVRHMIHIKCVYCDDTNLIQCDKYKEHVEQTHPNYAEIKINNINAMRPIENGTRDNILKPTKEMQDKANYLSIDRSRHLPEKPPQPDVYICNLCGARCSSKLKYNSHAKEKHGYTRPNICDFCFKMFKSGDEKFNHEDDEHAIEKYLCETCGKDFGRSTSLRIHKQNVHLGFVRRCQLFKKKTTPGKSVLCNYCGKSFVRTAYLKQHIACKHNTTKPYECDICGKAFSVKTYLKTHKKTHLAQTERKFACTFCSYKSNKRHSLLMHLRIHTGEKPFKCSFCGSRFRISLTLRWHLENKHDIKLGGKGAFMQYFVPETNEPSEAERILQNAYGEDEDNLPLQTLAGAAEKRRLEEAAAEAMAEEDGDLMDDSEMLPPGLGTSEKVAPPHPAMPKRPPVPTGEEDMKRLLFSDRAPAPSHDMGIPQHLLGKLPPGPPVELQRPSPFFPNQEPMPGDGRRMAEHLVSKGLEMMTHLQIPQTEGSIPRPMLEENDQSHYSHHLGYQHPYTMHYM